MKKTNSSYAGIASIVAQALFTDPDDWCPTRPRKPRWPRPHFDTVYSNLTRWVDKLAEVTLNPQPLPPRFARMSGKPDPFPALTLSATMAGTFVAQLGEMSRFASYASNRGQDIIGAASNMAGEFDDLCGTMSKYEVLQKLLEWLRKHGGFPPPPPEPEPYLKEKFSAAELIVIGSVLANAGGLFENEIGKQLGAVGNNLIERGMHS